MALDATGRTLAVHDSIRTNRGDGVITAIDGDNVAITLDAEYGGLTLIVASSTVTYAADDSPLTAREARATAGNVYSALAAHPAAVDGAASVATMRTLGYTATQSPPGNVFGRVYPAAATRAALAAAISSLGSAKGTVHVLESTIIDAAVTIPANVALKVEPGAVLTKSGSGTLAINGPFEAPASQSFSGFTSGVTFGKGYVREVNVLWFGADPAGVADSTTAIQAAFDSVGTGNCTVVFPAGTYKVSNTLTLSNSDSVHILGQGRWQTKLQWAGTVGNAGKDILKIVNGRLCTVEHLAIYGDAAYPPRACILVINDIHDAGYWRTGSTNAFRDLDLGGAVASSAVMGVFVTAALGPVTPGDSDQGNDFHLFERVNCQYTSYAAFVATPGQSKGNRFTDCQAVLCGLGVSTADPTQPEYYAGGASFHWTGGFLANNAIDFKIGTPNDATVIFGAQSEGAERFFSESAETGNDLPLTIEGCRIATNGLAVDKKFITVGSLGPVRIVGNVFGHSASSIVGAQIYLSFSAAGSAEIVGNTFDWANSVNDPIVVLGNVGPYNIHRTANLYKNATPLFCLRPDELALTGVLVVKDSAGADATIVVRDGLIVSSEANEASVTTAPAIASSITWFGTDLGTWAFGGTWTMNERWDADTATKYLAAVYEGGVIVAAGYLSGGYLNFAVNDGAADKVIYKLLSDMGAGTHSFVFANAAGTLSFYMDGVLVVPGGSSGAGSGVLDVAPANVVVGSAVGGAAAFGVAPEDYVSKLVIATSGAIALLCL